MFGVRNFNGTGHNTDDARLCDWLAMFARRRDVKKIDPEQSVSRQCAAGYTLILPLWFPIRQRWFEIVKVDALQRFFDMQLARLAGSVDPVPIKHAIRCIGVLLDFKNYQSFA